MGKPKPEVVDPNFIRKSIVTVNSIVTLKHLSDNKILKVKIVNRTTDGKEIENDIQLVGKDKPLAVSIMNKGIGEVAKIANNGANVSILDIE